MSANCIDPLQSVVIAWRLRHLDVPDYTSLFLHSLAVDPDRPSFEITLDTDTVVRSVLGPALESMGFAFDEIGAIAARARSSTTVWAWTRLEEGSFLERAPKRTPLDPLRLRPTAQIRQIAEVTFDFTGYMVLRLTFTSNAFWSPSLKQRCDELDHAIRRAYPDYWGSGEFRIYDDGSFKEAVEKLARIVEDYGRDMLRLRCPQVGDYPTPEWLLEK